MANQIKQLKRKRRHLKIRAKISGTAECPRISVFKSNRYTYAQLIDDQKGKTLVAVSSQDIISKTNQSKKKITKTALSLELGQLLAEKASKKKIKKAVFDRGGYKFHGRVKALAEGIKKGGLKF
ncbi:50S ribosomal protein L18 [Patescibacteria group bacterium]|nr:50S ribosomal protein L18 [Patescibacteria group bacterium]